MILYKKEAELERSFSRKESYDLQLERGNSMQRWKIIDEDSEVMTPCLDSTGVPIDWLVGSHIFNDQEFELISKIRRHGLIGQCSIQALEEIWSHLCDGILWAGAVNKRNLDLGGTFLSHPRVTKYLEGDMRHAKLVEIADLWSKNRSAMREWGDELNKILDHLS